MTLTMSTWERSSSLNSMRAGLPLQCQRHTVAERQHAERDSRIGVKLLVEFAQGGGVFVSLVGIGDAAGPQNIVDHDDAAGAHQFERAFIVAFVIHLVGVDERE